MSASRRGKRKPPAARALVRRVPPAALEQVPAELRGAVVEAIAAAPAAGVVVVVINAPPAPPAAPPVGELVSSALVATVRDLVAELRYARGEAPDTAPTEKDELARELAPVDEETTLIYGGREIRFKGITRAEAQRINEQSAHNRTGGKR